MSEPAGLHLVPDVDPDPDTVVVKSYPVLEAPPGVPRVPDMVQFMGKVYNEDPDDLGYLVDQIAMDTDALVQHAVWWDQSGRPKGEEVQPGKGLWDLLVHLAEAAKGGGMAEGCRSLSTFAPPGQWFQHTGVPLGPDDDDLDAPDEVTVELPSSPIPALPPGL